MLDWEIKVDAVSVAIPALKSNMIFKKGAMQHRINHASIVKSFVLKPKSSKAPKLKKLPATRINLDVPNFWLGC